MKSLPRLYAPYRAAVTPGGAYTSAPDPRYPLSFLDAASFQPVRTGTSVPGWKRKLANHESATSAYSATYYNAVEWEPGYGYRIDAWHTFENGKPGKKWMLQQRTLSSLGMKPTFTFLDSTNAEKSVLTNQVAEALLSRENQAKVKADALVTMGEFAETLALLKAPLKQIPKHVRRYLHRVDRRMKKAEKKGKRLSVEQMNNLYLGFMLGVAPLIGDIEGYAEAAAAASMKESYTVVQATVHGEPKASTSTLRGSTSGSPFTRLHIDTKSLSVRAKSGIKLSLDAGDASSRLLAAVNLDGRTVLKRFIPSMWELIPFSFLLDYVGNFGAVIDSRYGCRTGLVWCSMTLKETSTSTRRLWIADYNASAPLGAVELIDSVIFPFISNCSIKRTKIERRTDVPLVSFSPTFPNLRQASIAGSLALALSGLSKKADKILKRHFQK